MSSVTKREMVEILNEIAEAIETNRSEGVRHMAWRLEQEIERLEEDCVSLRNDSKMNQRK